MTYPNNIDYFVAKIDKNASGWYVSGENFNVPSSPYNLYLDHVPNTSATTTILPSGGGSAWTEDFTGSPGAGEYYIDYDVGRITFNSADTGTELEAQYDTLGDDIMAEHINDLQASASGIELEIGLGARGVYQDIAQRLDSFLSVGDTISATDVTCTAPPGASFTNVQQHISASGTAYFLTEQNPHGLGWNDLFYHDGDILRAQNNIRVKNVVGELLAASGTTLYMNWEGPDRDQWMYFYDSGTPVGEWFKWDDGDDRFELSDDLYVHGDIIASGSISASFTGLTDTPGSYTGFSASGVRVNPGETGLEFYPTSEGAASDFLGLTDTPGSYTGFEASGVVVNLAGTGLEFVPQGAGGASDHNLLNNLEWSLAGHTIDAAIIPTASGTQSVGTAAIAFGAGYFDNLYGDGSMLTGIGGGYTHEQGSPSTSWTVPHGLGTEDVIVQVTNNESPKKMIVPQIIEYTNANTVTVTFPSGVAGEARVVSASGAPGGGGGGGTSVHSDLSNLAWSVAAHTIDDNVLPDASGVRDLGSASRPYATVYTDDIYIAQESLYIGPSAVISGPSGIMTLADVEAGPLSLNDLATASVGWGNPVNTNIVPDTDGAYDLGSSSNKFDTVYADQFETGDAGIFYWGDPTTNGTWRIIRDGNNLVVQRRESSTWVTKSTFTP